MKKPLFLILFLITCISFGAKAQSTLTIADCDPIILDNRTSYLPVWGEFMHYDQHNQLMYYAKDLAPLLDGQITKITFHSYTNANETWGGATGTIKLMHTTEPVFADFSFMNTTSATEVYSGALAIVNHTMTFNFTTPFTYTGDNLVIDLTTQSKGVESFAEFDGVFTPGRFVSNRNGKGIMFMLKVTFEYYPGDNPTYSIIATATTGGTINPSGQIPVEEHQNKRFDFEPNDNYFLSKVLVDNVEIPEAVTNSYYIFNDVTNNHTIRAEFELLPEDTYTIAASAGDGGKITPSGNVEVLPHQNKKFEFKPEECYELSRVLVDHAENFQALNDGYYIFTDVTDNHTIHAEFRLKGGFVIVADGTLSNGSVPISSSFMDCAQHVQMIYTEDMLQELVGKKINKMRYYAKGVGTETFGGVTGTINVMSTNANSLEPGFLDLSDAREIYSGPFAIANTLMDFEFSTPFTYTGGNILIDIATNSDGEPAHVEFWGIQTSYLSRYSFTYDGHYYNNLHAFTPKTMFEYELNSSIITASASTGGTISPSGEIIVYENNSRRFDFTPDANYLLSKVIVDNEENAQALIDHYYTFSNVTTDHTIHAEFTVIDAVSENVFQNIQVYAFNNTLHIINKQQLSLNAMEIIDMMGKIVYRSTTVPSSMNLNFSKGIYIVRLTSNDYISNTKIIIE